LGQRAAFLWLFLFSSDSVCPLQGFAFLRLTP